MSETAEEGKQCRENFCGFPDIEAFANPAPAQEKRAAGDLFDRKE